MDILSIIGVLFIAMILSWAAASYFISMGVKIGRIQNFVQPAQTQKPIRVDGFVRRMPGQEPGYIEEGGAVNEQV